MFASSCVTKNVTELSLSIPPKNAKELIAKVNSKNKSPEWLALKGKVRLLLEKDNEVSLGISIRVRKDSLIWASVTAPFGIELFRAVLTKDSVYYINRTSKTYFVKPIAHISKIIKTGKLEEMSEEELELKMKKILEDYAPILNAKVVEALPEEVSESELSSSHKKSEKQTSPKSE